jgi:hypothetical protein
MFFFETTGPVATKLGRNIQCIIIYKVCDHYSDWKSTAETRGPKEL